MRYCSQDADIRDDVSAATGDYSEAKRRTVHSKIVVHYACVFHYVSCLFLYQRTCLETVEKPYFYILTFH